MDDSISELETRPYSVYLMEDETQWYIGSAWGCASVWGRTPEQRYKDHHSNSVRQSGAPLLWQAIQDGCIFTQRILDHGVGTLDLAHNLEESWIANFMVEDPRVSLNVNLFPSRVKMARHPQPTHCPRGHEYNKDNAYRSKTSGSWICKICQRVPDDKRKRLFSSETHCPYGHEWTEENTYIGKDGYKRCRICIRTQAMARKGGPKPRPRPTHCKWGHEFTPDNTYTDSNGYRQCQACRRVAQFKAGRLTQISDEDWGTRPR